jgi:hypothetical protein
MKISFDEMSPHIALRKISGGIDNADLPVEPAPVSAFAVLAAGATRS